MGKLLFILDKGSFPFFGNFIQEKYGVISLPVLSMICGLAGDSL